MIFSSVCPLTDRNVYTKHRIDLTNICSLLVTVTCQGTGHGVDSSSTLSHTKVAITRARLQQSDYSILN
jgi:hypothetical protein